MSTKRYRSNEHQRGVATSHPCSKHRTRNGQSVMPAIGARRMLVMPYPPAGKAQCAPAYPHTASAAAHECRPSVPAAPAHPRGHCFLFSTQSAQTGPSRRFRSLCHCRTAHTPSRRPPRAPTPAGRV